ncbi:hypothetical protein TVAG_247450 [Trichomonas vaginalis G3]|uniref:N-acetylgalactosaminide beta-1,3-galactosyltransferase n=1 Tax=Trichomonas vaginalis (strain ATCC PRA-98 / G3) TaxID=412133 RepID=A2DKT3_TRIV3|nr:glycosyltransferase family 31 protein family [Trichomonas vaginalis G3]EAY19066.1 hypothetical protein TVAG_247450 [Trichomonas vaginalis G3]KAI5521129.1 glycosyltransferase family 31 protein family [Trichomonas vaginalis G3]|eukprot:XP_001580052.1 hypothetical protein [Trichomonas vaginalis G3]
MEMFYRMNTSKKWYFFCDDDSYPVMRNLYRVLTEYDPNEKKVLGHFYCSWSKVVYGVEDEDKCLLFAQGGAGVAISNAYFKVIAPYLTGCNNNFTDRNYAGSMRFAKCSEDHVGKDWDDGYIISRRNEEFFSCDPVTEINFGEVNLPPVNFHFMPPKKLVQCHYGIRSDWIRATDNQSVFVDWTNISGKAYSMFYGPSNLEYYYRFGWTISVSMIGGVVGAASSPLVPQFADWKKDKPIGFIQNFSDTATVEIICDDSVPDLDVEFVDSTNRDMLYFTMKMKCPPVEEYKW